MKNIFLYKQNVNEGGDEINYHGNTHGFSGGTINYNQADNPEVIAKFKSGKKII